MDVEWGLTLGIVNGNGKYLVPFRDAVAIRSYGRLKNILAPSHVET